MTIRSGRKKFRYRYIPNEIKSKLTIKTDLKTYIQLGLVFMMYISLAWIVTKYIWVLRMFFRFDFGNDVIKSFLNFWYGSETTSWFSKTMMNKKWINYTLVMDFESKY